MLTALATTVLSLVDIRSAVDGAGRTLSSMAVTLAVGGSLALAQRAAGVRRQLVRIIDVIILIAVGLSLALVVAEALTDGDSPRIVTGAPSPIWLVMAVVTPVAVVTRLFRHRQVTGRTIIGAVAAYLLVANAFTFAFLTADALLSTPFFGSEEPTTSFMYFSLVTITTLGYGDLSPVPPAARLLATSEAVIGQVYLVTVVAMLVGLAAQRRVSGPDDEPT